MIGFHDGATRDEAARVIQEDVPELTITTGDQDSFDLQLALKEDFLRETRRFALQQNLTTLRNRVNELGVAEPIVQQQGLDRIVVQLPGVQDTARAKEILGATATLEFRLVDEEQEAQLALDGKAPFGSKIYQDRQGNPVLLKNQVILTGEHIIDAASGIEQQTSSPAVFVTLDGKGARLFGRATEDAVGRLLAVVFIENKAVSVQRGAETVQVRKTVEEVINVATIREQLGKRFQITGLDSTKEARDLALLLRAGALAAPLEIIEERTVGPSLGQDNIEQGVKSAVIGLILVMLFTAVYYGRFGLIANLALVVDLVLLVALMSMLQATLTLPGIAGIILTVGMAVDANVLIFERIREELMRGNTPQAAIHAGYDRAIATIADSNITTLIAAVVLFGFGSGPVKGFAVTLSLGILTSMFTAILVTRAIINLLYGGRRLTKESLLAGQGLWGLWHRRSQVKPTRIDFMGKHRLAVALSLIVIIVSVSSLGARGLNFGVDFTGGTLIELEYDRPVELDSVRETLAEAGFKEAVAQHVGSAREVLVRLPSQEGASSSKLSARVLGVLQTAQGNVHMRRVEYVGPQVGDELTEDGGLAMLYALLGILIYVALRFESRFSLGAVAALVHDVIITLGIFSLAHINFDLNVLAAILAVIGYSLNDTIVIFDRVRENFRKLRKGTPVEVFNVSMNETLARTVVTGVTTLLVLVALLSFGGELLLGFSFALIVGVIVGTYSSIYIASTAALALGVSKADLMPVEKEFTELDSRP